LRDRLLLAALRAIPSSLAKHVMFVLRSNPELTDAWEHHIRPIHYYEPLPDFREVTADQTLRRRESPAIAFDLEAQVELQARLGRSYGAEVSALADRGDFTFRNGYFDGLDAALYYGLIRDLKPRRVIEIGSGFSTRIAAKALARNLDEGSPGELICIEPFPEPRLTAAQLPITLVRERVEQLPLDRFEYLQANDVLFIDSSHALKFGGDVYREFLEILPVLRPGVWVHVHDIFFPHDYPAEWMIEKRFGFNEQYLLEAFLAFNTAFKASCGLHWLWSEHRDALKASWPPAVTSAMGPLGPASFWMKRVG
jgi:predicted O-methyltransferase YrrM